MKLRRVMAKALLLLLLGAAVNMVLAWTFDRITRKDPVLPRSFTHVGSSIQDGIQWSVRARFRLGVTDLHWSARRLDRPKDQDDGVDHLASPAFWSHFGMDVDVIRQPPAWGRTWYLRADQTEAWGCPPARGVGWPCRALWHQLRSETLPWRPIWSGFTVNSLLFASALWALFAGPLAVRRTFRRRRRLCEQCAFPIGASTVCTECGTALSKGQRIIT